MRKLFFLTLLICIFFFCHLSSAEQTLAQKLSGHILLQVESKGEAWYVNPGDNKKYYLGKPDNAFQIMREFGIGISDNDLNKISIGLINYNSTDSDSDGLPDDLENAIGINTLAKDSDNDGYEDKTEIINNYNPLNTKKLPIDKNFSKINAGKIFLRVESKGEAWYVNPRDLKRYFLGKPADAFTIMRELGLGITNQNLNQIELGYLNNQAQAINNQNANYTPLTENNEDIIYQAADAIRRGDKEMTKSFFTSEMQVSIEYVMNFLDTEGKLTLGNILSGAKLTSSNEAEKIYTNEIYFPLGGYKVPIVFIEKKQDDGTWKMTNL
ncbi:MAG: hypothetical protein PHT51_04275 [Patescibacteria group bacterium]|nr:hypothetical protein [Patescibacteria group bacterium]MDD4610753.1 hypothetical protein [Patescibacteria group bacterium]